jgi:hypothetical protein
VAALVATAAVVGLVRVWQPSAPLVGRVSPVRLALAGKEGEIFGQVFGWSVVLPLAMCVIV